MPERSASGIHVRGLTAAACVKERKKKSADENAGSTLMQWRFKSEKKPLPGSAGLSQIIAYAPKSYRTASRTLTSTDFFYYSSVGVCVCRFKEDIT